jgi:hypothetical protein
MKKIILIYATILMISSVLAQVPEKMSYQAVVRDVNNALLTEQSVSMKISILQGSSNGTPLYVETQTPISNTNGLVSIEIGEGIVVLGNFSTIDWSEGPYYIKTETDPTGGASYTITGTSQLLSVPYALHAKTVDIESDPVYSSSVASGISVNDTINWNNKLNSYIETDPLFINSVAAGITEVDTAYWNNKETAIEINDSIFIGKIFSGGSSFAGDSQQPGIATMSNIAQPEDKILSNISFYSLTTGVQRFGIGSLDQRNWGIIDQEFELDVKKGMNEINVLKYGYKIPANQQLFAYYHYSDRTELLSWNAYSSTDDNTSYMLYGSVSGVLSPIATPYGGYINLKYDLVSIESPFVTKSEFEQVKSTAEKALSIATKAYNNLGMVSDRSGNKYRLEVVNSQLQVIPLQYKNVLVISHSYGIHHRIYSYGWGGIRGMASSVKKNDFVHLLETGLKQKETSSVTKVVNVAAWERNFTIDKGSLLDAFLTSDVDCIIFRAGENVADSTGFSSAVVDLMNYCFDKVPSADGYISSMLFPVTAKDQALEAAADSLNLTYVNFGITNSSGYTSRMGDYVWGDYTADEGGSWDENTQVLYPISYSGVAGHPGDYGMLHMANSILEAMGYSSLKLSHSISVNDNSNIGYTCFEKWVEGGVFNIHTKSTAVSAVDASGNSLEVLNHNDGVFTFIMPDSDVEITISN